MTAFLDAVERESRPVGLVLGTPAEAATPLAFSVLVADDRYLQLDDVVHVRSLLPGGDAIDIYGIVDEVRALQEGVSFDSDVRLVTERVLPVTNAVVAHVSVTRVEPEIFVPPVPGTDVYRAHGAARDAALFFDGMQLRNGESTRLPFGLSRSGEPIYGNLQFLDGTRGAHINISGISGVATKTSYAMFLLYSLFESEALGAKRANTKALVFNVKGEDLLHLDQPNQEIDARSREDYGALGLPLGPFGSVAFYAPASKGAVPVPTSASRKEGVASFYWTVEEFCRERYLRFLFTDADSQESLRSYVVDIVERELAHCADESRRSGIDDGTVYINGDRVGDFEELVDAIEQNTDPDDTDGRRWAGSGNSAAAVGTIRAFLRRLRGAVPYVGQLVRARVSAADASHRIDWDGSQLTVVALNSLHDRAQRFVVGVLLKRLMEEREQRGLALDAPRIFVVLDELNKYAPRDGDSPIKDALLDIAERGRSLGVILVGAQQTASQVESRIVANCSFRVVGRLDTAEAQRNEYGFLTEAARARASLLKPGTMILHQPEIPVPLLVRFPFPAWATRASEVPVAVDEIRWDR